MIEILIGFLSGIFSGMGLGGGTILILFLTMFLGQNQHIAQATNLIVFIPAAISAVVIGIKNKNINLKVALITITFGVVGATIGAVISTRTNVQILRKMFGFFLIVISFYEIYSWYKMYIKSKK